MLQHVLEEKLNKMNPRQREAVEHTEGPLLILAGAGSGKTTVLINRIAYLLSKGLCAPYHVLAITFTNKAAKELCDRIDAMMGSDAFGVTAATFHSFCGRVLRAEIAVDGVFNGNYTIYDTDDGQRVIKAGMKALGIEETSLPARSVQWAISRAKDMRVGPAEYCKHFGRDLREEQIAKVYAYYDAALREANALDFDDMILKTVELFENHPEVLAKYAGRFRYIMVDEYQDTNPLQYRLVSLLSSKFHNLCVVGDDDQSIYKFRGATIENILLFEEHFPNAKVVRLEQNYRSTANILDAANAIIAHNTQRKGKELWTSGEKGEPVYMKRVNDDFEESRFITETVQDRVVQGAKFGEFAVLYRTNAQANSVERYFVKSGIPYKVVGGFRFYERKEIKDILAYMQVVNNPRDDLRLKRIINEPKRKIGATTIAAIEEISHREYLPMLEVMRRASEYPTLSRTAPALIAFASLIDQLTEELKKIPLDEWVSRVARDSGYIAMLELEGTDEAKDRINNIMELCTSVKQYQQDNPGGTLSGFLEEVSLMTDLDQMGDENDRVVLMTLHSAKGLEFNYVFMIGMEEGLFPSQRCLDDGELEEERRLMYVGVTRARKCLWLLHARQRMLYGRTQFCMPSVFLKELPVLVVKDLSPKTSFGGSSFGSAPSTKNTNYGSRTAASPVRFGQVTSTPQPTIRKPVATPAPTFNFNCGDRVKHKTFGNGTLVSKTPMGSDFLLEVQFDTVGTKKIMANFAKLMKAEE
ncbi:MAG: UvrD-helicase domain-containing protein [Clostridia bacterium]|nr:UvrD-helicase domain-containing protein [Clostridia bacterium]